MTSKKNTNDLKESRNVAIIFAGGVGARMGYVGGPKQFMNACGAPILIHTLSLFQSHPEIDDIYLAVVKTHLKQVAELIDQYNITKIRKVVEGGSTAHGSIINTLAAAREDGQTDDAIVLIHDGVRPIIPQSLISANITDTLATGSSITSINAFETVCVSEDGVVVSEVYERSKLHILQAPQAFSLGKIWEVNEKAIDEGTVGSFVDMANMMRFYGHELTLTPGIRSNRKITILEDFEYFQYIVENGKYQEIIKQ